MARNSRKTASVGAAVAALNMALLASVVEETNKNSFLYVSLADAQPLLDKSYVEINAAMVDEKGAVATRATDAGIAALAASVTAPVASAPVAAPVAAVKPSAFVIKSSPFTPIKASGGGGRGGEKYPFSQLAVGQHFHIPATEDEPEPWRSFASTVSSATARFAEETGEMETVAVPVYKLDANGRRMKDAEGHYVRELDGAGNPLSRPETRPKLRKTRDFRIYQVGADYEDGAGAIVKREA